MAHNLEYNVDRQSHSFFSRKELAWHKLGQVVKEAVTAEEALKLANLDFEVELKHIYASLKAKFSKRFKHPLFNRYSHKELDKAD